VLIIANKELAYQNCEKEKRAGELVIANKKLAYQNKQKGKRADELVIANVELAYQNTEKEKRADELVIANIELAYQNTEKEKRADELIIANEELAYQNKEKEKRAEELVVANNELLKIAFLQSHQVRVPIANILGLFDLFEFNNPSDPINGIILKKLKTVAESFDKIIQEIVQNNCEIKTRVKEEKETLIR
jgi:signal transduction histidine kinase